MYNCVESYTEITAEAEATGTYKTYSAPGLFAMHEQDSRQGAFFCQRLVQAPSASSGVKISARTPSADSGKYKTLICPYICKGQIKGHITDFSRHELRKDMLCIVKIFQQIWRHPMRI